MEIFKTWAEIYKQLSIVEQEGMLELPDQELLATAAYLIGKDTECFRMIEQVHLGFLKQGNTEKAARCAFWLGLMLMNTGERARGDGWIARGQRLLDDHEADCAEKGLFLIPIALGILSGGDGAKAQELFEQAVKIGNRFSDSDLIALARLGQGQAMTHQGNVLQGVKLLDEVMIAVETEDIFPLACGIIYCAVIETCYLIFDIRRAQEWTAVLSQWCESQPGLVPFRGQCLIRRSQIRRIHGECPQALNEIQRACQILSGPPGKPAAGEAYYQQAEIFRLKGDYQQAKKYYLEANKWGRKPQPGLALLRLAQNEKEMAVGSIQSALDEAKTPLQRIKLLPACTEIMIAHHMIPEARLAVDELLGLTKKYETSFLRAITTYCQGAVLLKEDDPAAAIGALRKSLNIWNELNAPYETASARLLLGIAYREKKDHDSAKMELTAAQWIFSELEAIPDLEKVNALMDNKKEPDLHGLTLRELQVLRLVSEGDTNKAIAGKLFISERTVERHLSNIFNKLGVYSRTEATTFAFRHEML